MVQSALISCFVTLCNGAGRNIVMKIGNVRRKIREAYRREGNWEKVSRRFGVSKAMAWRIANEPGYEPKDPTIRKKLGLRRGRKVDWMMMDEEEVRRAFEERCEF